MDTNGDILNSNGDILVVANKDDIIFINLISCLSVSLLLKQLSKLSAVWRSKKYLFEKNFWKLLSKHLWLFLVKFYDFSIFFWTPLGEHLKYQLTLWEASSCVKSVQLWSHFWSVFFYIRTAYRKIRTRNNSVFGYFSRSAYFRHSNNIQVATWNYKSLIAKWFDRRNALKMIAASPV